MLSVQSDILTAEVRTEGGNSMSADDTWVAQLQQKLKETIYQFFEQRWQPFDDGTDRGFAADVWDTSSVVDGIEILEIDRTEQMMKVSAVVDRSVTSVREVKDCVRHLLGLVDESFFIFLPCHDEEALRFWYMTGTPSHGHEGIVILKREDIPHITS